MENIFKHVAMSTCISQVMHMMPSINPPPPIQLIKFTTVTILSNMDWGFAVDQVP